MKKTLYLLTLLIFVLVSFSSCYIQDKNPINESSFVSQKLPPFMSNIGKTFNEIKELYPSYEYLIEEEDSAFAFCFGNNEKTFAYYFMGGHDGPTLLA